MTEEYRLFTVHYAIIGKEGYYNAVDYQVARNWQEAKELFLPQKDRLQRNGRALLGDDNLECKIEDIRELDIVHTGWKIRLERKEE